MGDSTSGLFIGKCVKCGSYDTRIRTEDADGIPDVTASQKPSQSRVYECNACNHVWKEMAAR